MATGGSDTTSDEIFNFKCTACIKINRNREAVKFCIECKGYCCQACVEIHQYFPTLVNHNLLDKSNFKSAALTAELPVVPTERCSIHGTKILDMYCQNHDEIGCTTCMALDHRSCKDLQSVPDVIDSIFQRSDMETVLQTLINKQTSMRTAKEGRDKLLQELQRSKIEAIDAVKDFREEIKQLLNNLEKKSKKKLETEIGKMESALKHERQTAEKEEDALQNVRKDLQKAEGNKAQEFVCMKIAQKKSDSAEAVLRSLKTPTVAKMLFSANQEIISFLQQLKSFGAVISHRSVSLKRNLYTVKSTKEIDIRTQNDTETCLVYGSCLTQDGMLLLADCNNKTLKRADMFTMVVVDKCNLPDKPWGVCCLSQQEAVVTLFNSTVQFVSIGNKMKATRQLKLNHDCSGIAYNDNRLYITDHGKSLYIHDMTGSVLQTVRKDSYDNDLFRCSNHIAFSDNGDNIFIVNGQNGVVVLDAHGTYIDTFIDRSLNDTSGVCTDNRGNIFVCDYHLQNVVQISQDGKEKYGEIIKSSNGIDHLCSVTFNPCDGTLVVTQVDCDKVWMFELE